MKQFLGFSVLTVAARARDGIVALAAVMFLTAAPASVAQGAVYYIDFEHGSDNADGLSQQRAWKHAPGDAAATGGPARARLQPGDTISFKGGVAYRGSLKLTARGSEDRPITLRGDDWGTEPAILSGRDRLSVALRPCAEDAACREMSSNPELLVADLPSDRRATDQYVLDGKLLSLGQFPGLNDSFWSDDISTYATLGRADILPAGADWRLTSRQIAGVLGARATGDMFAYLWGMPNLIYMASVQSADIANGSLLLQAPQFRPYGDRDGRFALVNHAAFIRKEFDFATIAGGRKIVVMLRGGSRQANLEIGTRPLAIEVVGASNLKIQGFVIEGYAGGPQDRKGGVALWLEGANTNDIAFVGNRVRDLDSGAGSGAVQAIVVNGLKVENSVFQRLRHGSGIRAGGNAKYLDIIGNTIDLVGRTGIALLGTDHATVRGNYLRNIRGVHGNAISAYLATRAVVIENNAITQSVRGITFHGGGGGPNDLVIRNNVIVASGPSSVGIQSWGKHTDGVEIAGNLVLTPPDRTAIHLKAGDQRVSVVNNVAEGIFILQAVPVGWTISGNVLARDNPPAFRNAARLSPDNRKAPRAPISELARSGNDFGSLCAEMKAMSLGNVGPADMCRGKP